MPKATATEEEKFKLPKDVPLPAALNKVEERLIEGTSTRTGEDYSFTKWNWEFQITDGDYAGLRAWLETEDKLTTHPENKVRMAAEALLGVPIEIGMDLDTDELIGLPCEIVVDHVEREKKDGTMSYRTPITQVFPFGTTYDGEGEPPF